MLNAIFSVIFKHCVMVVLLLFYKSFQNFEYSSQPTYSLIPWSQKLLYVDKPKGKSRFRTSTAMLTSLSTFCSLHLNIDRELRMQSGTVRLIDFPWKKKFLWCEKSRFQSLNCVLNSTIWRLSRNLQLFNLHTYIFAFPLFCTLV